MTIYKLMIENIWKFVIIEFIYISPRIFPLLVPEQLEKYYADYIMISYIIFT